MALKCHLPCIVMRIKFGEQSPGWRLVGVGHSPPCICDPSLQLLQTSLAERKPTFEGEPLIWKVRSNSVDSLEYSLRTHVV